MAVKLLFFRDICAFIGQETTVCMSTDELVSTVSTVRFKKDDENLS